MEISKELKNAKYIGKKHITKFKQGSKAKNKKQ